MYSGSAQQDAQEFLRYFLDTLHSALNTAIKPEPVKMDDSLRWVLNYALFLIYLRVFEEKENSVGLEVGPN